MRPVGEQQLIGLISLRCSGEAQPFEEAFALREVDQVVAHRFGVEVSNGEVRRRATAQA
jgi:hypothetical protein